MRAARHGSPLQPSTQQHAMINMHDYSQQEASCRSAETVERSASRQQLEAEYSYGFELLIKFASSLLGAQGIKEVGQLYAAAHRIVGFFAAQRAAYVRAVRRMVEALHRFGRSQCSARQRLHDAEVDDGKELKVLRTAAAVF